MVEAELAYLVAREGSGLIVVVTEQAAALRACSQLSLRRALSSLITDTKEAVSVRDFSRLSPPLHQSMGVYVP